MALKEIFQCESREVVTVSYDLGWQHSSQSQEFRMAVPIVSLARSGHALHLRVSPRVDRLAARKASCEWWEANWNSLPRSTVWRQNIWGERPPESNDPSFVVAIGDLSHGWASEFSQPKSRWVPMVRRR